MAGESWKTDLGDGTFNVKTCVWSPPGDHPVGCGVIITVKDGKILKVEGDPDHPISQGRLCPRCLAMKEFEEHPDRLRYPMKRAREDRGKNTWERITWDEALDIIEEKVNEIGEKYGKESIMVFTGTGREATLYATPLATAALGSPNSGFSMSGSSCYGPRCSVADFLLGAGYPELDYAQFFPDRYDDPRYEVPKYVLVWGKDPLHSNPDSFFGHSVIDLMKRGTQFITIDPRVTWLGVRAPWHLQLRPGTDAALALALLNVVITEDLYDHEFVEKWTFGFDALAERVQDTTPEWAAEICWLDPEDIRAVARAFATNSPSSLLWGLAFDTQQNGTQAGQAVLALVAICGYMDVPGGVLLTKPRSFMGQWRYDTYQELTEEMIEKRIDGKEKFPAFAAAMQVTHIDTLLDTLESGKPYNMHMAWFFGTNALAGTCFAEPDLWYELLMDMDFNVCNDVFMTPTAMGLCDLVLPNAGSAAHDGVVLPHFGRNSHFLGAMNKAIDPGECKSDIEIDMLVGKRLNPEAWPWDTPAEFFTDQIRTTYDFDFEELQEKVVYQQPFEYRKYEKGLLCNDGQPGFDTPTGKIELKSALYPGFGEDALPYFQEPPYSPYSTPELAEEYPLVLTTGARELHFFHSEHRQIPSLRALTKQPLVTINPETAKEYGIENGDWVCIENMFGKVIQTALVSPVIKPRVVHAQHGWWFPEQEAEAPNLFGVFKSNINKLIPNHYHGKLGFGAPYKNMICKIYKVDGPDADTSRIVYPKEERV